MSRAALSIAGLALVFAASFGAGAATQGEGKGDGAKPLAGFAARPLERRATARIDPLSAAPRLPALRTRPREVVTGAQPPPPPPPVQADPGQGTTPPQPPPPPPPPQPDPVLPPEADPQ